MRTNTSSSCNLLAFTTVQPVLQCWLPFRRQIAVRDIWIILGVSFSGREGSFRQIFLWWAARRHQWKQKGLLHNQEHPSLSNADLRELHLDTYSLRRSGACDKLTYTLCYSIRAHLSTLCPVAATTCRIFFVFARLTSTISKTGY